LLDHVGGSVNEANNWKNPYGDGKTADKIVEIIQNNLLHIPLVLINQTVLCRECLLFKHYRKSLSPLLLTLCCFFCYTSHGGLFFSS